MASKKVKAALEAKKSQLWKFTFETKGTRNDFVGKVKDSRGRVILEIVENEDYNTLSRIINTSKYMKNEHDMKGLAAYLWDRSLVPMEPEEREEWNKKEIIPVEVTEVRL